MTASTTGTTLQRLQHWYHSQCNGDWEQGSGISITTLDNPGWRLVVDLSDTALADKPFDELKRDYEHELDWIICVLGDGKFEGHCGPRQLHAMLEVFLAWAEES